MSVSLGTADEDALDFTDEDALDFSDEDKYYIERLFEKYTVIKLDENGDQRQLENSHTSQASNNDSLTKRLSYKRSLIEKYVIQFLHKRGKTLDTVPNPILQDDKGLTSCKTQTVEICSPNIKEKESYKPSETALKLTESKFVPKSSKDCDFSKDNTHNKITRCSSEAKLQRSKLKKRIKIMGCKGQKVINDHEVINLCEDEEVNSKESKKNKCTDEVFEIPEEGNLVLCNYRHGYPVHVSKNLQEIIHEPLETIDLTHGQSPVPTITIMDDVKSNGSADVSSHVLINSRNIKQFKDVSRKPECTVTVSEYLENINKSKDLYLIEEITETVVDDKGNEKILLSDSCESTVAPLSGTFDKKDLEELTSLLEQLEEEEEEESINEKVEENSVNVPKNQTVVDVIEINSSIELEETEREKGQSKVNDCSVSCSGSAAEVLRPKRKAESFMNDGITSLPSENQEVLNSVQNDSFKSAKQIKVSHNPESMQISRIGETDMIGTKKSYLSTNRNNEVYRLPTPNVPEVYNKHMSHCSKKKDKYRPIKDPKNDFFIAPELVQMYQDGLMLKKWNATQCLYELCSQCEWLFPEFQQIGGYSLTDGFYFGVKVNSLFIPAGERGRNKKEAKNNASKTFLNHIGFDIPSEEPPVSALISRHAYRRSWQERWLARSSNTNQRSYREEFSYIRSWQERSRSSNTDQRSYREEFSYI